MPVGRGAVGRVALGKLHPPGRLTATHSHPFFCSSVRLSVRHWRISLPRDAPLAHGQAFYRVLVDPRNQPEFKDLAPGMVRRLPQSPDIERKVLTDAEGRYTIAGLAVGTD
jgi:hypothetical protein